MIFFIAAGLFSIISSIFNWNFFFENSRAYFFVKIFGRNGARIFYSLLGALLIYLAFKL
ncbi:MAG: immunity 17 family protein [Chitinophagales bacterium]|nr:immunity 17 family protein [Bacteroidota bacterium]MCB9256705.1 immunity 17 family protein [Chitinophagales bacterium]